MFLAGLKFALGLVVGLLLVSGIFFLSLIAMDLLAYWRKKCRRRLWEAKARAPLRAVLRFRERAVFQFFYRSDDWLSVPDKTEFLR
jgi:hypothetical protein